MIKHYLIVAFILAVCNGQNSECGIFGWDPLAICPNFNPDEVKIGDTYITLKMQG